MVGREPCLLAMVGREPCLLAMVGREPCLLAMVGREPCLLAMVGNLACWQWWGGNLACWQCWGTLPALIYYVDNHLLGMSMNWTVIVPATEFHSLPPPAAASIHSAQSILAAIIRLWRSAGLSSSAYLACMHGIQTQGTRFIGRTLFSFEFL